ncbi:MFS transporter [Clostridium boliviensis]|uniref:MFS transporter n=1 Tax=Clostridium boliviensis TaxID=318465 RepID=A0ABU4GK64_9CLOT|nr:MFS transporter [Clostridium boliviensis]MDW2798009.1 MFS transporter [Clostridium boliviensis]
MGNTSKPFGRFILLWSGELISAIGGGLTSFGLGVYVYQQSGMASQVSFVLLLAFLPSLLLSAPAGVLADRYDRRILMILGDSLSAIGPLFILFALWDGEAAFWQICIGVTISSVFFSLLEPAYRATVTDLLTEEQYTKASGFVQMAGSAKYLISPAIAGLLLKVSDIRLLLILDICTFFVTVMATMAVRKGLEAKPQTKNPSFAASFKDGWKAIAQNKGVLTLVLVGSVITLCLGFIQTLAAPMILSFSDSGALGTIQSLSAMGMLVSSVLLGIFSIKKAYVKILCGALFCAGVFMALFGFRENLIMITIAGFLFFSMLPFSNMSIDYLLRTNIKNEFQGRAWGLVGLISQMGYVFAYGFSGLLADRLFTPLLMEGGSLSGSAGRLLGTGKGRGSGFLIIMAGILLCIASVLLYQFKSIQRLEKGEGDVQTNHLE